jgi:CO/xanthine dehydrogenase Mo-binding subunit
MAAIANAICDASGLRMPDLPISPPKLRAAIDAAGMTPLLAAE